MLKNTIHVVFLFFQAFVRIFVCRLITNIMKKIAILLFIALLAPFVTLGQTAGTTTCNLSVTIDSTVVPPCFRLNGNNSINGGACGCTNSLWAIVNGGNGPYTYTWTTSNGFVWGNADTIHGACYELWNVKVGDANGCVDSASINVVIPVTATDTAGASAGIIKYGNTSTLKLYPVPASNQLNVNLGIASPANTHIEVYDVLGNKLFTQTVNTGASVVGVDVSSLSAGSYLLRIVGSSGQKTTKFTVDR
jgi:hypothetical protein